MFLPPEIIAEILSWLPVKSIQRLKCVCRTWLSIAEDREFIDKQMARIPSYWAVEEGNGHLIRNICGGLILEMTDPNSNYRLRNPSTKRALDLPHHDERDAYYLAALYDISSTKSFKVVFPSANGRLNGKGSFKILTVGIDDEWRTVDFPFECSLNLTGLCHHCCADLVEGVYIVVLLPGPESEQHEHEIVMLEVESEKVWRMSIPQQAGLFSDWSDVGLMIWAGKPSVYQMSDVNELLCVWVVEDCKKQKWAEEMIAVDLTPVKDLITDYIPYCFYWNQICMYCSGKKLLSFDIVSKVVTHIASPVTTPVKKWQGRASLMEFKGMKPLA